MPPISADVGLPGPGCLPPDPSDSPETAYLVTADDITNQTLLQDTICPRSDWDYWKVSVSGERQLVKLAVEYRKSGNIALGAEWWGVKELCVRGDHIGCSDNAGCQTSACAATDAACATCGGVRQPTCTGGTCTANRTDCAACGGTQVFHCNGGQCDAARNGCRSATASTCFADAHCESGESCTPGGIERLNRVVEPDSASTRHRLTPTIPAFIPGDYYIKIFDDKNNAEDAATQYELTVATAADPDVYEPNNALNTATNLAPLLSGGVATVNGFFSYENDEDWFVLDPSVAPLSYTSPPVVAIDVRWPDGAQARPTWSLDRGGLAFAAPAQVTRVGTTNSLKATLAMPTNGPLVLRLWNASNLTDDVNGYTLTFKVVVDADEALPPDPTRRNDDPNTATVMNVSTTGNAATHGERLIASNDVDWYRVDRATSVTVNSLLQIAAVSASTDYLLDVQLYRNTGQDCGVGGTCGAGGRCITATNKCIEAWTARPPYDLRDNQPVTQSREFGGPTPNAIDFQVPLYYSSASPVSQGVVYVLVQQIPEAATQVPGFSATVPYTLTLTHKAEPDLGDRSNEDNCYVPRPLFTDYVTCNGGNPAYNQDGVDKDGFFKRARTVSGNITTDPGSTGGHSFALLSGPASATAAAIPACTALSFVVFDDTGTSASGVSFDLALAGGGSLWLDSACSATPFTGPVSLPATAVYYLPPTTDPAGKYVTITATDTAASPVSVDSYLPVYLATSAAPVRIAVTGPRSVIDGSPTPVMSATVSSAPAALLALGFQVVSGSGGTVCDVPASSPNCANAGAVSSMCPDAAPASGDCQLPIPSGATSVNFELYASGVGLTVFKISGPAGYVPRTWVLASIGPASIVYAGSVTGEGFISYEGDSDFFKIPLGASAGMGLGHMTATLTYTGSVQLRVAITRNSSDSGFCRYNCGIAVTGSNCTPCQEPGGACNIVASGGSQLNVWVNDEWFDDRDDRDPAGQYSFTVTLEEGCASSCPALWCTSN
ncbi:MAG: hypothetical protein HY903_17445 [Deltaproteobacteria bacterium]|nr:hypothetical protein [Deltaproteobacteria bacterium]